VFSRLAEIPPYSEDDEHLLPPVVAALKAAITAADAVLIATPEYNGSIPGQLKNALDWVSRPPKDSPLRGKPAAVIGASTGLFGAVWAQAELRKVLKTIGARMVESELPVAQAHETLGDDGLPRDPAARAQLQALLGELVELAQPLAVAA
jgi:chromate reductase